MRLQHERSAALAVSDPPREGLLRGRLDRYKVLAAGVCSLILTLGPARFAYTPLLPLMQAQAHLGAAAAGWLASINYIGYLSGAFLIGMAGGRVPKDRLYQAGLLLAVASTGLMGVSTSLTVWAISRYLAGLSGAAGMLLASGLVLSWLIRNRQASGSGGGLGVHFAGIGLAIVVSTAAVMAMSGWSLSWRQQWYGLTLLGAVLALPALMWMPAPAVSSGMPAPLDHSLDHSLGHSGGHSGGQQQAAAPPSVLFLKLLMAAYFCAGVGYVISATFIVAIIDQLPSMKGNGSYGSYGSWVFLSVGLAAVPASVVWDLIARRMGDINALLLAAIVQIAGIVLPLLPGLAPALCGAVLFGAAAAGIVSLVLAMAGRFYPGNPARMMGRMTVAYGLAQVMAPAVVAALAAHRGSYQAGLYLAAAVMLAGVGLLLAARRLETPRCAQPLTAR